MEIQLYQYHPIVGYQFIPNLKLRVEHEGGGYLIRTNAAGFRCEHEFIEKKSGRFRILLFGDSFTAGDAVSNKHRFGDVLEKLMPEVEIYNFGLPGTGTDQHYLVYKEIAKAYEHDLVIIAAQVENIRRVAARHRLAVTAEGESLLFPKPYFEFNASGDLELKGVPVSKDTIKPDELPESEREFVDQGGRMLWLRSIINKMGGPVKDIAQRVSGYQPLPEYDDPNNAEWRLMKAILTQWAAESMVPAIVVPIPIYHYVEETASPESYRARFRELVGEPNVYLHDPLDDYYDVPKPDRRAFRFDTDIHPTPAHHQLLAESISKAVRSYVAPAAEGAPA